MKQHFFRRPDGPVAVFADVLRIAGLLSVIALFLWGSPTDAGILAFILPALVAPRFISVQPWFDAVFCLTLLVAAWSNVADAYRTVPGWDTIVHVVCTAVLSVMVYLLLARIDVVPQPGRTAFRRRSAIVLTTLIGLAISALWEMVEWIGFVLFTEEIFVTYDDTIGDMAAGGLGALLVGVAFARAPFAFFAPAAAPRSPASR